MYYNYYKVAKLVFCVIFGSAVISNANAQDKRAIDSLQNLLKGSQDEKQIMGAKVELGWYYLNRDDVEAYRYSSEGYELAEQFGDSARMVKAGRVAGQALRRLDRLQESIEVLAKVLPIAKRNQMSDEHKKILNSLALAYTFKAEYDKALKYNFQSLIIREAEGDKSEISTTLNNIGLVYFKLHNYEGALKYYNQCLELKRDINSTTDLDITFINIGLCYNQLGNFLEARKYFFRKGSMLVKMNAAMIFCYRVNLVLGVSYFQEKDFLQAQESFLASYELAVRSKDDQRWQAENLVYLGNINTRLQNFKQAEEYLSEAEKMAKPGGYSQLLIDTYSNFSNLFNELKYYEKASAYQQKYISLKDSLFE